MPRVTLPLILMLLTTSPLVAQLSDEVLLQRIEQAETDPTAENLVQATAAARLMRDYPAAQTHFDAAWEAVGPLVNGLINNRMFLALASGEGVTGAQRAFRQLSEAFAFSPIQISNWAGQFPEILWDGEFDEMMLRLSLDATDPAYRCACYNTIAWVHRLAGRHDEATEAWAMAVQGESPALRDATMEGNADAEATLRGQYARNLARAGRHDEARRHLERAMSIDVSAGGLPVAQRRWAQAYAELGDAAGAVAQLEPLLAVNSLISVHTLEARAAWMLIRDDPAFQALLARHR